MLEISLDLLDTAELVEMLTFLAGSLTTFAGHPAYNTDALCADLHRFAYHLSTGDGEELFGEPTP
jgi:hypothetical protein